MLLHDDFFDEHLAISADMQNIYTFGQHATFNLRISCAMAFHNFLPHIVIENVLERMFKANVQPITCWIWKDSQLVHNAVNAKDGDLHGGKCWDGFLPLIVESRDTISVSTEIEEFR